jgi:hypothetical protein
MQTTQTQLMTTLTKVGNMLDCLDFRENAELTQNQARKLLRARREINAQLQALRRQDEPDAAA